MLLLTVCNGKKNDCFLHLLAAARPWLEAVKQRPFPSVAQAQCN